MNVDGYSESELYELWSERAAIYEFDGGLSRDDAQYRAAVDIRTWMSPRKLPDVIWREARRK
jgi:hypothetical protein